MDKRRSDYSGNLAQLEEMLPGIEEYLCMTLAEEHLSDTCEEKRMYFIERLDILRLPLGPPIIPPRSASLIQSFSTEEMGSLSSLNVSIPTENSDDFAAMQRELSRTLAIDPGIIEEVKVYDDIDLDTESLNDSGHIQELDLYEIPITTTSDRDTVDSHMSGGSTDPTTSTSGDKSSTDADTSPPSHFVYDIRPSIPLPPPPLPSTAPPPLPPRRISEDNLLTPELPSTPGSSTPNERSPTNTISRGPKTPKTPKTLNQKTSDSSIPDIPPHSVPLTSNLSISTVTSQPSKSAMSPNISHLTSQTSKSAISPNISHISSLPSKSLLSPSLSQPNRAPSPTVSHLASYPPKPPNLSNIASPDSTTYLISALSNHPPDLPERSARPPLPPRMGINQTVEKPAAESPRPLSMCDATGDETSTSYESYDEEHPGPHDPDLLHKLNIKLPIPFNKRRKKKLNKSVSSLPDGDNSFKSLPDVTICGDLLYHGKISWSRRLSAVSKQRLLCYKPEKLSRPSFVIPLNGYHVTVKNRDTKRGTDLLLTHPDREVYEFCVEYREWANSWSDYIQAAATNSPPPGKPIKLYRYSGHSTSSLIDEIDGPNPKQGVYRMASNRSVGSLEFIAEGGDKKDGQRGGRIANLANRATLLFESLGKRKGHSKTGSLIVTAADMKELKSLTTSITSTSSAGTRSPSSPDLTFDPLADMNVVVDKEEPCTHKGYMNVFSNFNRKSWGKWLCVVRGNDFLCYRSNDSKQADITLPLRECEIKHACAETGSEKSLMLLIDGQEKITVEAPTFEDLEEWLRVLVCETGTTELCEGLQKYYIEEEYHDIPEDGKMIMEESQYSVIRDVDSTRYLSIEDLTRSDDDNDDEEEFDPAIYTPVRKSLKGKRKITPNTNADSLANKGDNFTNRQTSLKLDNVDVETHNESQMVNNFDGSMNEDKLNESSSQNDVKTSQTKTKPNESQKNKVLKEAISYDVSQSELESQADLVENENTSQMLNTQNNESQGSVDGIGKRKQGDVVTQIDSAKSDINVVSNMECKLLNESDKNPYDDVFENEFENSVESENYISPNLISDDINVNNKHASESVQNHEHITNLESAVLDSNNTKVQVVEQMPLEQSQAGASETISEGKTNNDENDESLQCLLKSWDIKAKILHLENLNADENSKLTNDSNKPKFVAPKVKTSSSKLPRISTPKVKPISNKIGQTLPSKFHLETSVSNTHSVIVNTEPTDTNRDVKNTEKSGCKKNSEIPEQSSINSAINDTPMPSSLAISCDTIHNSSIYTVPSFSTSNSYITISSSNLVHSTTSCNTISTSAISTEHSKSDNLSTQVSDNVRSLDSISSSETMGINDLNVTTTISAINTTHSNTTLSNSVTYPICVISAETSNNIDTTMDSDATLDDTERPLLYTLPITKSNTLTKTSPSNNAKTKHKNQPPRPNDIELSPTKSQTLPHLQSPMKYGVKSRVFNFEQTSVDDSPNTEQPKRRKMPSSFSMNFFKQFTVDSDNDSAVKNGVQRRNSDRDLRASESSESNSSVELRNSKPKSETRNTHHSNTKGEPRNSSGRGESRKSNDSKTKGESSNANDSKTKDEARSPNKSNTKGESRNTHDSKPKGESSGHLDSKTRGEKRDSNGKRESKTSQDMRDHVSYTGLETIEGMNAAEIAKCLRQIKNKLVDTKKLRGRIMDKKSTATSEKERSKYKEQHNLLDVDVRLLNRDIDLLEGRLKLINIPRDTEKKVPGVGC